MVLILGSMGILVPKVSALMTKAQYLLTQWCAHDMNWGHAALRVQRISGPEVAVAIITFPCTSPGWVISQLNSFSQTNKERVVCSGDLRC